MVHRMTDSGARECVQHLCIDRFKVCSQRIYAKFSISTPTFPFYPDAEESAESIVDTVECSSKGKPALWPTEPQLRRMALLSLLAAM